MTKDTDHPQARPATQPGRVELPTDRDLTPAETSALLRTSRLVRDEDVARVHNAIRDLIAARAIARERDRGELTYDAAQVLVEEAGAMCEALSLLLLPSGRIHYSNDGQVVEVEFEPIPRKLA